MVNSTKEFIISSKLDTIYFSFKANIFYNPDYQYIDTLALAKVQIDLGVGDFATHSTPIRVVRQ